MNGQELHEWAAQKYLWYPELDYGWLGQTPIIVAVGVVVALWLVFVVIMARLLEKNVEDSDGRTGTGRS